MIDTFDNHIKDKIQVDAKIRSIAVNTEDNVIYLAGKRGVIDKTLFVVIDSNNNYEIILEKIAWQGKKIWELHYNQINKKLYAFVQEQKGENSDVCIQEINLESKSFGQKTQSRGEHDGMGFDPSRTYLYFSDVANGEFSVFNHSLKEIGLFRFTKEKGFMDKYFKGHLYRSKITVNSSLGLIYIAGSHMKLLHIIKE